MTDPFGADALDIAPADGLSFEITSPAGLVGRARFHTPPPDVSLRGLRHALDGTWTTGGEFTVEDPLEQVQYRIVRSGGTSASFTMALVDSQQRTIGTAVLDPIRVGRTFPDVHLAGPAGEPLGRVTTRGRSEAYDASGHLVAEMHVGATKVFMGKPLHQVRFVEPVPGPLRALVVAVVLCRTLR